jgi:hypothetical protein
MGKIPVRVKLLDKNSDIQKLILGEIEKKIGGALLSAARPIRSRVQLAVGQRIRASAEYASLISGQLQGEFGLDDSLGRVESILNIWLQSIDVIHTPVVAKSKTITGGFKVQMINDSFRDVINTPQAIVNSKGGPVPWLEWLLLAGDALLIGNYSSNFNVGGPALIFSRSGQALMTPGGNWRVPSAFSGTRSNNWVTRALFGVEADVSIIIQQEIENKL